MNENDVDTYCLIHIAGEQLSKVTASHSPFPRERYEYDYENYVSINNRIWNRGICAVDKWKCVLYQLYFNWSLLSAKCLLLIVVITFYIVLERVDEPVLMCSWNCNVGNIRYPFKWNCFWSTKLRARGIEWHATEWVQSTSKWVASFHVWVWRLHGRSFEQ